MNLNQVTLPVREMPTATAFYRKLGFLQIVDSPHYARFECPNGISFSLILESATFDNTAVIYFEQQGLDEWVDSLLAKGIVFDQMPTDMRYLWREAITHDPSGNKIKLYWAGENRLNPPWRVELADPITSNLRCEISTDNVVEQCVETLCQKGCKMLWADIDALEKGVKLAELAGLSLSQRLQVLTELKAIIAVYDSSDGCAI